jgi:hypothetical protein
MAKTLHFKSKAGYGKWLAFGHMHGAFARVPGDARTFIAGKPHKVKHKR